MAMRRREQAQAAEASGASSDALTERWYELRNLLEALRTKEARIAELTTHLARVNAPTVERISAATRAQRPGLAVARRG